MMNLKKLARMGLLVAVTLVSAGCDDADDAVDAAPTADQGPDGGPELDGATPDGATPDGTAPDAGPVPTTHCDPDAPVKELCGPPGEGSVLEVDLKVVYQEFEDILIWHKPGNTPANMALACKRDVYQKVEDKFLRVYSGKLASDDEWLAPGFPGPTLRVKIGDTLRLTLENAIDVSLSNPNHVPGSHDDCEPGSPERDVAPNCFHGLDTTNIHYHGTHVSPEANHDNVFVQIFPSNAGYDPRPADFEFVGTAPQYELQFGEGQLPGTHWYHAHKHGSTAIQMLNGLAGALIIEGDFAGITEIEAAEDQVLVLQEIDDSLNLLLPPAVKALSSNNPTLINGELTPTITMRPGEVQRWRFISATQHAAASFNGMELRDANGMPFFPLAPGACADGRPTAAYDYSRPGVYQVAQDGIEFLDDRWPTVLCNPDGFLEVPLRSGNRADFLIVAPQTDERIELTLTADKIVVGNPGMGGMPNGDCGPQPDWGVLVPDTSEVALLRVVIDPTLEGPPMRLPEHLRRFDQLPPKMQEALAPIDVAPVDSAQTVSFSMIQGAGQEPKFYIDCKQFCEERLDHCMVLDTAEEWTIYNFTEVAHPFHIHINPFFVTHYFDATEYFAEGAHVYDPNVPLPADAGLLAADDPRRRWQDTIGLPSSYTPPANGDAKPAVVPGFIKVRHRFLDFTGDFVIHCHILGHEDRGMMQRIGVRGSAQDCTADLEAPAPSCEAPSACCQSCLSPEFNGDLPAMCTADDSRVCTDP